MAVLWPGSCESFCGSHGSSYAACTALPGCGWCGGGGQCVEASYDGGPPGARQLRLR